MSESWSLIGGVACGALLTGCVRGANHHDKGLPCQDASMASIQHYKGHPYALLVVADGHGAARYTRSEVGAHLAVQAATEVAARWVMLAVECMEQHPNDWMPIVRHDFGAWFARSLRKTWERNVDDHIDACPIADVAPKSEAAYSAYGTTVAVVLVLKDWVFAGAIGDSKVFLVLKEQGGTSAVDVLAGERVEALGLAVDSLAASDAAHRWKHQAMPVHDIELMVAATDGFTDSLAEPLRTLATLHRDTQTKGFSWLQDGLPGFLQRLTDQGVGDDIATVFYFPPKPHEVFTSPNQQKGESEIGAERE